MTKFWDSGRVKTRLGVAIGMDRAASLHRLFVSYLSATLGNVADRNVISVSPDEDQRRIRAELDCWELSGVWEVVPQGGGNLGARIARWFQQFLVNRDDRAILIGADCPTLDSDFIAQAAESLKTTDVVLGPAVDGGYYLVGLRGCWESNQARFESLFRDVPWSTNQVMRVTRERLKGAGMSHLELETREDVDTIVELTNLRSELAVGGDRHAELKSEIDRIISDAPHSNPSG